MAGEQYARKTDRVRATIHDLIGGRQLVVLSNREPYTHQYGKQGVAVERPEGGLVAALDPVLQTVGGVWVAWGSGDADFDVVDARDCVHVPIEAPQYMLRRVRLSRQEVERSYHGFSNQSLWPLFHLAVDKARFVRRNWTAYQVVNRRFADAALEVLTGEAVVWIHDYHLALCASYLRQQRPDLFLMHFWHIPWPAWDVLRICPQSADLLEGLLANDLLGFHLPRHVQNFLDCAEHELGARVDRTEGIVEHAGRYTRVQAFPISIDVAAWDQVARSRACERWMTRLRHRFRLDDRFVVVGVDRLDYTKGIPERLGAIDLLFQRSPDLRNRLVFIQKAAPSRTRIAAYRRLQDQIEHEIRRINSRYGNDTWQPIIYIPRLLPMAGMAALYRMADACLVTSLQDGMNLVAKEFIASQVDEQGTLVLSSLAGAVEEASWSLAVNPFEPESVAVLLDFDGTLASVADHPDGAYLTPRIRTTLARLTRQPHCLVAIISGRALADLQRRVGMDGILYVGNHGLEVAGPGRPPVLKEARRTQNLIAASCDRLRSRLRDVHGALVEDKGLTASVHYRLVPRGQVEAVHQAVLETLAEAPPGRLVMDRGRLVLEIRPAVDWDKGRAAMWLLESTLGADWQERNSVVYVGDDRTDEDAFLSLAGAGITVKVGSNPYPTAAHYFVSDVDEVASLLDSFVEWATPAPARATRAMMAALSG